MNNGLNIQLDHQKSMILYNISAEAKKTKVMARYLMKESKGKFLTSEREVFKTQAKRLIEGTNKILNESRKMHFKGATVELIRYLDEVLAIVKSEREGLELTIKLLK